MAHMRKFNMSESVHLCKHYERSANINNYGNSDVDVERSNENYNLGPDRESQVGYIRQQLDFIQHVNRKDLVVMGDLIITCPVNLPEAYRLRFFEESYNFGVDRYGFISGLGEDVVISAYVHMDEAQPHMHFAFLTVKAERDDEGNVISQRFCAKEIINRQDLRTLHRDLQAWMDEKGIPAKVMNGNTKFDSNGKALSVKELKRGDKGTERGRWRESAEMDRTDERSRAFGRW